MTPVEIVARFQPSMPNGIRFAASFPLLPYQDEEGNWHEPAEDSVAIRIATAVHYVDTLISEADLQWTDSMFYERVLQPMFSALERIQQPQKHADANASAS